MMVVQIVLDKLRAGFKTNNGDKKTSSHPSCLIIWSMKLLINLNWIEHQAWK
jgi:hypothetical protein